MSTPPVLRILRNLRTYFTELSQNRIIGTHEISLIQTKYPYIFEQLQISEGSFTPDQLKSLLSRINLGLHPTNNEITTIRTLYHNIIELHQELFPNN
jgi:hypothetical protein